MQIYVINLKRASDRLRKVTEEFQKYGLSFERIDAYDAKGHSSEETQANRLPEEQRHFWLMELTDGEIACYLSHKLAWKKLLESGDEWAFVAEDDMAFSADPREVLEVLSWIPESTELVQLSYQFAGRPVKYIGEKHPVGKKYCAACVVDYRHGGGATQGYLIHRNLAAKLLAEFPKVHAPIDDMLFFHCSPVRRMTNILFLCPGIVGSDDGGVSFLQAEKAKVKSRFWRYPIRYVERKLIKWKHALKCRFVYKEMIR